MILSPENIEYTGIKQPTTIVALGQEGVNHRKALFNDLQSDTLVVQIDGVEIPGSNARIQKVNLNALGIKKPDWALASLGVLAELDRAISMAMLEHAINTRFKDKIREKSLDLVRRVSVDQ